MNTSEFIAMKDLIPGQYYKAKRFEGYYIGTYSCLSSESIAHTNTKVHGVCTMYKMYGFYLKYPCKIYHVIKKSTSLLHIPDVEPLSQEQIDYHYKLAHNSDISNAQKEASIKKILKFVCEDSLENLLVNDSDFIKWCSSSNNKFILISPDERHIITLVALSQTNMIFSHQHRFEIIGDMHYTCYNMKGSSCTMKAERIQQLYPGYTAFKYKDSYAHIGILDNTGQIHRNIYTV